MERLFTEIKFVSRNVRVNLAEAIDFCQPCDKRPSMSEKRDFKRKRKRLKLRFGVDYPKRVAFTEDISERGIFVITGQPEKPGTKLLLEITLPDEELVIAYGRVQWAKKVPPNLVRLANKGGMGIMLMRFESGEQLYKNFVADLRH